MISYGRQTIEQDDVEAVLDVLQSDYLTQGPTVQRFETRLAEICQVKHAISCTNGSQGLTLALQALGVTKGDHVWTSPISFVASANCALACGAEIDFVDICTQSFNISLEHLENKLDLANQKGELPKAIVVVHMAGSSMSMKAVSELANKYGVFIVEDACHALGGAYQNKPVGSCLFSDLTVFSFHPVKSITTAEGGAITTNNSDLYQRLVLLSNNGITKDRTRFVREGASVDASDPKAVRESPDQSRDHQACYLQPWFLQPWYYEQQSMGVNARMSDLQAALGLSQLKKLMSFIERRRTIAAQYRNALSDLPITFQKIEEDSESAFHLFIVLFESFEVRNRVYEALRKEEIFCQVHYIPIYRQPFYESSNKKIPSLAGAEYYFNRCLSLPIHPNLNDEDVVRISEKIHSTLQEN